MSIDGRGLFLILTDAQARKRAVICWVSPNNNYTSAYSLNKPHRQVYLTDAGAAGTAAKTLQQLDFDHFTRANLGIWLDPGSPLYPLKDVVQTSGQKPYRKSGQIVGRMRWINELSNSTLDGSTPKGQNANFNGILDYNYRATRFTRHPFDLITWVRTNHDWHSGLFTSEVDLPEIDDTRYAPFGNNAAPIMTADKLSAVKQFVLFDLPFSKTGVLSLGALQHAPLTAVQWAPSMAFANARPTPFFEPDRTGLGNTVETAQWTNLKDAFWPSLPVSMRQETQIGSTTNSIIDWSYELNHAMWDTYFFSGIPAANDGWSGSSWLLGPGVASAKAARNSRYEPAVAAIPAGGYFGQDNFRAYRVAATLLQRGAFNVNSTSVPAWTALLSAFRGIRVSPAAGTDVTTDQVPFSRFLQPKAGVLTATSAATFRAESWAGFRALNQGEIQTLAEKIVAEVKARGPFLGLADFVNRRLKPAGTAPAGQAAIDTWELDYLGTIQSAIEKARLNARFDVAAGDPLYMDRTGATDKYGTAEGKSTPVVARQRSKHRDEGSPGFLTQADVLQHIGPVLTARSDTFVIRAKGVDEDSGAEAFVEMTVQRTPEPLIPDTSMPINPVTVRTGDVRFVGNQKFGRRCKVVALRWLTPDEI